MSTFFLKVFNLSIMATYVTIIVLVLRFLLQRFNVPKLFSYLLWIIVLFRLLSPFTIESNISMLPKGSETLRINRVYVPTDNISINDSFITNQNDNYSRSANNSSIIENTTNNLLLEIASILWMVGCICIIGYGILTYLRFNNRVKTATKLEGNIYETDQINTAFVLGIIKPIIYIPTNLSDQELDYIIEHEKTHIRRRDNIIKLVAFLTLALHWFNPIIWLAYNLMIIDMEMSCDESVIKRSKEDIRANYSKSLLAISEKQSGIISPLAFGESHVKSRIRNVLNYKRAALWLVIPMIILGAIIAVGLGTNPLNDLSYYNNRYGFILTVPSKFADKVEIREHENFIYFIHKKINQIYPDPLLGVVGRIEVYSKKDFTKEHITEIQNMYDLKIVVETEDHYIGYARPTDVQVPPNSPIRLKEEFRGLEKEFESIIDRFETSRGTEYENIMNFVESFGQKLKYVSLQSEDEQIDEDIKNYYSNYLTSELLNKWLNNHEIVLGRLSSSPWPEKIEVLSILELTRDSYILKGNLIEVTSTDLTQKAGISLIIKKVNGSWLIDNIFYTVYDQVKNETVVDDYSIIVDNQVISLGKWYTDTDIISMLGMPITVTNEILGGGSDTMAGAHVKTLIYDGIVIKMFSPKGSNDFWIESINLEHWKIETTKGVKIGSSLEFIKSSYMDIQMVNDGRTDENNCAYIVSKQSEYKHMVFEINNGIVKGIKLYIEFP